MRLVILFAFLCACAKAPWKKFSMKEKPDFSCYTGFESGRIAYVWDCYEGKRVVIYQTQSGMMTFPAKKKSFECNRVSLLEKQLRLLPATRGACWKQPQTYIIND